MAAEASQTRPAGFNVCQLVEEGNGRHTVGEVHSGVKTAAVRLSARFYRDSRLAAHFDPS